MQRKERPEKATGFEYDKKSMDFTIYLQNLNANLTLGI